MYANPEKFWNLPWQYFKRRASIADDIFSEAKMHSNETFGFISPPSIFKHLFWWIVKCKRIRKKYYREKPTFKYGTNANGCAKCKKRTLWFPLNSNMNVSAQAAIFLTIFLWILRGYTCASKSNLWFKVFWLCAINNYPNYCSFKWQFICLFYSF